MTLFISWLEFEVCQVGSDWLSTYYLSIALEDWVIKGPKTFYVSLVIVPGILTSSVQQLFGVMIIISPYVEQLNLLSDRVVYYKTYLFPRTESWLWSQRIKPMQCSIYNRWALLTLNVDGLYLDM